MIRLLQCIRRPYTDIDFTRASLDSRLTFLRSTAGTRWTSSMVLESVAANVPRIDHDPLTGIIRGYLCERGSTNIALNSVFSGAPSGTPVSMTSWTMGKSGSPAAANVAGDLGAILTLSGAAGEQCYYYQSVSVAASTAYTFSVRVTGAVVGGPQQAVTITGLPSGASITRYAVDGATWPAGTDIPSGTHVILCQVLIGATSGSALIRFGIGCTAGLASAAALGFSCPQMEAAVGCTSYIPTTTATVTRAEDYCSLPVANMRLTSGAGAVLAEYITKDDTMKTGVAGVVSVGPNNFPLYFASAFSPRIIYGAGSLSASILATPLAITRVATSYGARFGLRSIGAGGSLKSSAFAGTMTSNGNPVKIGRAQDGGTTQCNLWLRKIKLFGRELEAGEMSGWAV